MNRETWAGGLPIPKPASDQHTELHTKVYQAIGEASMCWSETPKGVFDSTNAERIAKELIKYIEEYR